MNFNKTSALFSRFFPASSCRWCRLSLLRTTTPTLRRCRSWRSRRASVGESYRSECSSTHPVHTYLNGLNWSYSAAAYLYLHWTDFYHIIKYRLSWSSVHIFKKKIKGYFRGKMFRRLVRTIFSEPKTKSSLTNDIATKLCYVRIFRLTWGTFNLAGNWLEEVCTRQGKCVNRGARQCWSGMILCD